jgi:hypothetical protein
MTYILIDKWRQDATIKAIVEAAFPDYRKHKVMVRACESVTLHDLNWSGGTRLEYRAVTTEGKLKGTTERWAQCVPWSNPAEGLTVPIPQGTIVVSGGHFCGKTATLILYVHPADMPKRIKNGPALWYPSLPYKHSADL